MWCLGGAFPLTFVGLGTNTGSLNINSVLSSVQGHLTAQHHQNKAHERHTPVSLTVQSAPRRPHLSREVGPDDTTGGSFQHQSLCNSVLRTKGEALSAAVGELPATP